MSVIWTLPTPKVVKKNSSDPDLGLPDHLKMVLGSCGIAPKVRFYPTSGGVLGAWDFGRDRDPKLPAAGAVRKFFIFTDDA